MLTGLVAYLWFFLWQFALERHPVAIGSGVVAFALLTAIAYASRERLKEVARSWLTGRVQRMFAQRVTRYRLPSKERRKAGPIVVSARESISQSKAHRPDPVSETQLTHDVTVLTFKNRGKVVRPLSDGGPGQEVRFIHRFDMSALFPRLHDAARGLASIDPRTGRVVIVDVPRNYELSLRAILRRDGGVEESAYTLVLNKNGLLRIEEP
jgi:hypothetical protein